MPFVTNETGIKSRYYFETKKIKIARNMVAFFFSLFD